MVELDYIYTSSIPNRNANSVHVMHFSEALSQIFRFRLFADHRADADVMSEYDIKHLFNVMKFSEKHKYLYTIYLLLTSKLSQTVYTRDLFCGLLLALGRKKVIWESHIISRSLIYRITYTFVAKLQLFNRVVVITHALRNEYLEYFDSDSVHVLPDACRLSPYCRVHKGVKQLKIGYVGSFFKGKGVDTVIKLARLLPQYDFVIIGGGALEVEVMRQKKPPNLNLLGYLNQKDLTSVYLDIDVALLPNHPVVVIGQNGQEIGSFTSPLKLFEYFSYGIPLVGSDLPVLREVLNEYNSITVPFDDLSAWSSALRALEEVNLRQQYGKKGHQDFLQNFSWDVRAKRIALLAGEGD